MDCARGLLLHQEQFAPVNSSSGWLKPITIWNGKKDLAVEILVEAVKIAGSVMEQQGRRPLLARCVAALEEVIQLGGIILRQSQSLHPILGGSSRQVAIQFVPQLFHGRQEED